MDIFLQKLSPVIAKILPLKYLLNKISKQPSKRPLLSDDEIMDLFFRVQNIKQIYSHKYDISHRRIGDTRSIYRGYGLDYEESRHYIEGDDPRYMNWQLTARTGKHYMKVFREERQPSVFIVIDRRLSMRFGTQQHLKVTQAVRAAATTAFKAQQNNLSVGGLILDTELNWFAESQNKHAIFNFIKKASLPAKPAHEMPMATEYNFADIIKTIKEVLTNKIGSYIYLISDFSDLTDDSRPVLLELASTHQVHAIQITDMAEIRIPDIGTVNFKQANTNNSISFDSHSKTEQDFYQSAVDNHFSSLKELFDNLAISYQEILTSSKNLDNEILF